jgi:hypothetical protein
VAEWRLRSSYENPHDAAVALRAFADQVVARAIAPVLETCVPLVKAQIAARIEATGIAHSLQGQKASKATLSGARSRMNRARASDKLYVAVYKQGAYAKSPALRVQVWGLASLLEQGGRTRAHDIPFNTAQYAQVARHFSAKAAKGQLGPVTRRRGSCAWQATSGTR